MAETIQIEKVAPNFVTIGVYKNRLGKIRLSDLNKKITQKYRLLTSDGFASPGLFILDKEGILQYYTVNNLFCGRSRSLNELLRILRILKKILDKILELIDKLR